MVVIACKQNLHEDEALTYGLANNGKGTGAVVKEGTTAEPSSVDFIKYLTVSPDNRFDYKDVWREQKNDVHPPLYYAVVHTICSLTPGYYSKWSAGFVNIICALIILYVSMKIAEEFTQNRFSLNLIRISFILCSGILSAVSFFRMYVMAMMWVTWITLLLIRSLRYKTYRKFYVLVFMAALCGALTHYYCIIYIFFISVAYGIILLCGKQWLQFRKYVLTMLLAGGCALLIFPAMIEHMLFSNHGVITAEHLREASLSEYLSRIKAYYVFLDTQILGKCFLFIICFILIYTIAVLCTRKEDNQISVFGGNLNKENIYKWVLLIAPELFYFLFISKTATYIVDRYIFPIYAIAFLTFVLLMIKVTERIFSRHLTNVVIAILFSALIINNFRYTEWTYLYLSSKSFLHDTEAYAAVDCICIYEADWKILRAYYEISHYKSITFLKDSSQDTLSKLELTNPSELIVIQENEMDEKNIENIIDMYPSLNKYKKIGGFGYTTTWYLD